MNGFACHTARWWPSPDPDLIRAIRVICGRFFQFVNNPGLRLV